MTRTLLLFGAGPGIGNHVASEFASHGIDHIILLARDAQRLETQDAPFVSRRNPNAKVSTLRCDLADLPSMPDILKELDSMTQDEDVEVIFFNAARIKPGKVLGVSVGEMEEDFRTQTLSLYLLTQHYLPKLTSNPSPKPAFLVTSSHLPWHPSPQLLSLSLVKASQKNMVESLHQAFSNSGVHIGLVFVEGPVKVGNKVLNPKTIAERVVGFWEGEGELECHLREE